MGQTLLTLWVEDDEAALIGEWCIFRVGVILACGSLAVMKRDEQSRRGCDYIRLVEVDQYVVGIGGNSLNRDETRCSHTTRDRAESKEQRCRQHDLLCEGKRRMVSCPPHKWV